MHKTYAYLFELYGSSFEGKIIILSKDINTAYETIKKKFNCDVSSTIKLSDDIITDLGTAREIAKSRNLL